MRSAYKIFFVIFLLIAVGSTILLFIDLVAIASIIFLGGVTVSLLILFLVIIPREKQIIKQNKKDINDNKKDRE